MTSVSVNEVRTEATVGSSEEPPPLELEGRSWAEATPVAVVAVSTVAAASESARVRKGLRVFCRAWRGVR